MPREQAAIDALEELGLTEYEARCFVALTRIPQGTAKEISQVSDVPRSRVYDTVERLHERGLVDVQQSDPRRYRGVSKEAALQKLREDFDARIGAAEEALADVDSATTAEDKGLWSISDHGHVDDRALSLLDDAEEGKLLLVDHRAVLLSGVEEGDLPGIEAETAMWSSGKDHGVAVWVRELLDARVARQFE